MGTRRSAPSGHVATTTLQRGPFSRCQKVPFLLAISMCNERTRTTLRLRGNVHAPEEGYSANAGGKFILRRRAWKRGSERRGSTANHSLRNVITASRSSAPCCSHEMARSWSPIPRLDNANRPAQALKAIAEAHDKGWSANELRRRLMGRAASASPWATRPDGALGPLWALRSCRPHGDIDDAGASGPAARSDEEHVASGRDRHWKIRHDPGVTHKRRGQGDQGAHVFT